MARFLDRYNAHPERGAGRYIEQATGYICSLTLQRGFGEDILAFLERRSDVKEEMRITHEDIIRLEEIAGIIS